MKRLVLGALIVAALGTTAAPASAKCSPDANPVVCFVTCTVGRLGGALCKDA